MLIFSLYFLSLLYLPASQLLAFAARRVDACILAASQALTPDVALYLPAWPLSHAVLTPAYLPASVYLLGWRGKAKLERQAWIRHGLGMDSAWTRHGFDASCDLFFATFTRFAPRGTVGNSWPLRVDRRASDDAWE